MKIKLVSNQKTRLDKFISENSDLSREQINKIIEANKCFVDGIIAKKKSQIINSRNEIILDTEITEKKIINPSLSYVYVDKDIIVINKEKNTITHGINNNHYGTLNGSIIQDYPEIKNVGDIERPGTVHRLDKGTSGLIIFSRSKESYLILKNMIKNRDIKRQYTALVDGKPTRPNAIIEAPILRDPINPLKRKVSIDGKYAKTTYKTLKNLDNFTLIDVELFTGRTHQIRVHMAEIGNPVVGDSLYGKQNKELDRPFLHSSKLNFLHPISKKELYFETELPKDLKHFLRDKK
ncbi:MAG: RluA family pseudouridine synthase [Dehalococcoidia bacterium]|nr:RluA family pseudouridine synthase [Dehalococcoidia bacterium]